MTPEDRDALAQQILDNALFSEIMNKMEHDALERCVYAASTDEDRRLAAERVRAIRSFRSDCTAMLRNNQPRQVAVA